MSGYNTELYNEFLNPGAEYRGKPFWAWNGRLEKDELIRQIHIMKEMGFGGFFMHSRTGLQTEYLGEEWFELINACADEAEKLGLEAWIYDEDRWPSGTAGGQITMKPEYRMKFLRLKVLKASEFRWQEGIVAAFACRLEGINFYEKVRISENTLPDTYDKKDILEFTIEEMEKSGFYNGYTYVDTLNIDAACKYLESTHEKYKKYCGARLGKSIKGIFTDEPNRGALMDSFGSADGIGAMRSPWTYKLFEKFEETYGYDLTEMLPEVFLKPEGKEITQVKWHYVELLQQMFHENFAIPIYEWCQKNNMVLTGHILHEDSLSAQTAMCGSMMRYYEHMTCPGVDVLTEDNYNYWIVKQLSSAARQLGKKWLLSEMYGGTGWQLSFEGHKAIGDWQALFGINVRCHHLSWYTMEGEAKRDYPASILHQSSWWKDYKHVEDYFSRMGLIMSQGKPCCDILVINPVESVWSQVHIGWSEGLNASSEKVQQIEQRYRDMFHWLAGSQFDFDYGDEDMLKRLYTIESDVDRKPMLRVGEAAYKVVLVGGMSTIRSSTKKMLDEFVKAGGSVVFAGDPPCLIDTLESDQIERAIPGTILIPSEKEMVVETLKGLVDRKVIVTDKNGNGIENVFCQVRQNGDDYHVLLVNIDRHREYRNAKITLFGAGCVDEWNCLTGGKNPVHQKVTGNTVEIVTDFPPCGEHLYMVISEHGEESVQRKDSEEIEVTTVDGPYGYELNEPNILVLDMAAYKINDESWQYTDEILKVDTKIRNLFKIEPRGGIMVQPWFAGKAPYRNMGKIRLSFEFFIEHMPEEEIELVMEKPDDFNICINAYLLDKYYDTGLNWIDHCFRRIRVPLKMLKLGRNKIELETDFNQGTNLEAIYLLGNFGVKLDGSKKIITFLPKKINIGDLVHQGLPFYSGTIIYKLPVDKILQEEMKAYIQIEEFEGACMKIASGWKKEVFIGWKPYKADITEMIRACGEICLSVILTRRNTFGPLHQVPLHTTFYSPESFVTEGENFSESYMLIPSGLLKEPKIIVSRDVSRGRGC